MSGAKKENAMKKAKLILDRDYAIAEIDPRIYGSFV